MSVATTGLFWALAYALFADERRFSPHRLWPALGLVALWALARFMPPEICRPFWLVFNLASVGLVARTPCWSSGAAGAATWWSSGAVCADR
jgi:cell division protein FtsW (lipid II flippase)